jgi:hypothetical protein
MRSKEWKQYMARLVAASRAAAQALGLTPKEFLGIISYETSGTFRPWKAGPMTDKGRPRGLIQWLPRNQRRFGITPNMPVEAQVAAVVKYLKAAGFQPGKHGLLQAYGAINAGGTTRRHLLRRDAANGGAPGTVIDKVNQQMPAHLRKAERILNAYQEVAKTASVPNIDYSKRLQQADRLNTAEKAILDNLSKQEKAVYTVLSARGKLKGSVKEQADEVRRLTGYLKASGQEGKNVLAQFEAQAKEIEKNTAAYEKHLTAQEKFDQAINARLEKALLEKQLSKEDLLAREQKLAIARAEQEAAKKGLVLSEEQRAKIRETVRLRVESAAKAAQLRAEQEAAAKEAEAHEVRINQLLKEREQLTQQMQAARLAGDDGKADSLAQRIEAINAEIEAERVKMDAAERQAEVKRLAAEAARQGREVDQQELATAQQKLQLTQQERAEQQQLNVAKLQAEQIEQRIANLQQQRDLLMQQYKFAEQDGDQEKMALLEQQINQVNAALQQAAQQAIQFHQAVGGPEADNAILKMQNLSMAASRFSIQGDQANQSWLRVQDMMVGGLTSAFDNFAKAVASGENAWKALGRAFRQFAADFLRQIAQMIIKQALFNSLFGGRGGTGGLLGGSKGFFTGLLGHTGGVVYANAIGTGNPRRAVSPMLFAAAPRYHSGGVAGLAPGEVPAILKQGEEVITRDDPRHRFNGNGGSGNVEVKVVNTFDPEEFVSEGLSGTTGQQAVLNAVRANPGAFRQALEE